MIEIGLRWNEVTSKGRWVAWSNIMMIKTLLTFVVGDGVEQRNKKNLPIWGTDEIERRNGELGLLLIASGTTYLH